MSTAKLAFSDIKSKKLWPVYYLFGDEPFKIDEFVEKLIQTTLGEQSNAYDIEKLDGTKANGNEIVNALQTNGLFGSSNQKIIIVNNANQLKEIDELFEILSSVTEKNRNDVLLDHIIIMISDTIDGRKKFHQWIKKNNYSIEFKKATDSEMITWVDYLAKKMKIKIHQKASQMLSIIADGSLYRLKAELEKAWLYAGADEKVEITESDVAAVSSQHLNHEMVELVVSYLAKKKTRALILAEKIIRTNEDALGFVGFATWAIKNPKWVYMNVNRSMSKNEISILMKRLLKLDGRLKSTATESSVAVEEFILS